MRLIFMGSPEIAVPSLRAAARAGDLIAVVTQPARGKGRGRKVAPSPVAEESRCMGIEPMTPSTVRTPEFLDALHHLQPDLAIVVAYGKILPPWVLETPRLGCVNVHASLLPELRGAAPIQWAIARGARETGVTLMQMDEGMDTGPVLLQEKTEIGDEETAETLTGRLSLMAADILQKGIPALEKGALTPVPQDHNRATYAPVLVREDGLIDWRMEAAQIANRVRGFAPWPGTFSMLCGKRMLITSARAMPSPARGKPGEILGAREGGLDVFCGKDLLRVLTIKPEGKREMTAPEFLAGWHLTRGDRFGG